MPIEMETEKAICCRCGTAYGRRKGYFPVSYSALYKGVGYLPFCKNCVDSMYNEYLGQCGDARSAVRQVCRKLDLFWSDAAFDSVEKKATTRTMMTNYIVRINNLTYAGKSYDDTLLAEGTMWKFRAVEQDEQEAPQKNQTKREVADEDFSGISDEVIAFWGPGYTPPMYRELEQRRAYWMSRLPDGVDLDIGTEAIIRQICSIEIDINRDRAAGRNVEKSIAAFNQLLGSANLKPVQRKQDDMDTALAETPLGVWLYRYENKRPLPEVDDDLKDVNGMRRYVFTWMGHLCKMLGLKNAYSQMYEDEIAKYSVEKPEYDGDDEELLFGGSAPDESDSEGE